MLTGEDGATDGEVPIALGPQFLDERLRSGDQVEVRRGRLRRMALR
jgi:hypothetical protein